MISKMSTSVHLCPHFGSGPDLSNISTQMVAHVFRQHVTCLTHWTAVVAWRPKDRFLDITTLTSYSQMDVSTIGSYPHSPPETEVTTKYPMVI